MRVEYCNVVRVVREVCAGAAEGWNLDKLVMMVFVEVILCVIGTSFRTDRRVLLRLRGEVDYSER
jgi:hypothetical protein